MITADLNLKISVILMLVFNYLIYLNIKTTSFVSQV